MAPVANLVAIPSPTTEWVDITPSQAEKWLGKNHNNRNQRSGKIAAYARDMKSGNWKVTGDSIKFDWNGRLIDGQHRLEAIIAAKTSVQMLIVRGLDPETQGALDVNAKRSPGDALRFAGVQSYVQVLPAMARIDLAWVNGRIRTSSSQFGGPVSEMTNTEVVRWVDQNQDAPESAAYSMRIYKDLLATPSPLAYAIMRTGRVDMNASIEFWDSTAEMRTEGVGDPRLTLIKSLKRMDESKRTKLAAPQISLFFRAWNAWRGGRKITSMPLSGGNGLGVAIPEPR